MNSGGNDDAVHRFVPATVLGAIRAALGGADRHFVVALDGLLPRSVVWARDKKGFPAPVGNWLRDARVATRVQRTMTALSHGTRGA